MWTTGKVTASCLNVNPIYCDVKYVLLVILLSIFCADAALRDKLLVVLQYDPTFTDRCCNSVNYHDNTSLRWLWIYSTAVNERASVAALRHLGVTGLCLDQSYSLKHGRIQAHEHKHKLLCWLAAAAIFPEVERSIKTNHSEERGILHTSYL